MEERMLFWKLKETAAHGGEDAVLEAEGDCCPETKDGGKDGHTLPKEIPKISQE